MRKNWWAFLIIVIMIISIAVLFGLIPSLIPGGCFPDEFESIVVEPACIDVQPGCISGRLEIRNKCNKDFIISNYDFVNTLNPIWYTSLSGSVRNLHVNLSKNAEECSYEVTLKSTVNAEDITNVDCSNLYIPRAYKTIIDDTGERFRISEDALMIEGDWK